MIQKNITDITEKLDQNGCRMRPPLPMETINAVEVIYHITLPKEYKYFLSTIGNGGAGPLGGLHDLHTAIEEYNHNAMFAFEGPIFAVKHFTLNQYKQFRKSAIILAENEIAVYAMLANGAYKGCVWFIDKQAAFGVEGVLVQSDIDDEPLGFLEWYDEYFLKLHMTAVSSA